jgi:hypothetical protein
MVQLLRPVLPPVLVYGGDDNMIRQGVTVQSWRQINIEN